MKGLKIKIQALLLCGVLITGLFSSCASDENIDNGNKVNAGDKVLTLTLNTPKATTTSGAKTRVTNMTQTTDIGTNENQINLLTIGIFDKLGTTVRTIQELSFNPSSGTTGTFTTDGVTKKTTATLVTNSLAADDQVLVAVNAPSGTFNGCASVTGFEGKAISLEVALATPKSGTVGDAEATDNIPMYGKGTITGPVSPATTYTSVVAVQHQLAKITLNTLGVAFDTKGPYASATFTPTSFFLINVPGDLKFNSDAWSGSAATYQGWDNSEAGKATYKAYLGTGDQTYAPLTGTTSITPGNIFYTMPNSDATTNNTKLVICGMFDPDGKNTSVEKVYYPVNINWVYDKVTKTSASAHDGGTIAKSVYPNKNYICKVYIMTKGAKSPTDKIDPEVVSVEVTVTPFVDADQTTNFE